MDLDRNNFVSDSSIARTDVRRLRRSLQGGETRLQPGRLQLRRALHPGSPLRLVLLL